MVSADVTSYDPHYAEHSPVPLPVSDQKGELYHLIDQLEESYVPAFVELVRACLPEQLHQRVLLVSASCAWFL